MMYASCVGVNQIQLCTLSEGSENKEGSLISCHFLGGGCGRPKGGRKIKVAFIHRASSHGGVMRDGLLILSCSWQGPCHRALLQHLSPYLFFCFFFFNSQLKATFVGKFCVLVKFISLFKK